MKCLLILLQPRDIPQFIDAIAQINEDKLFIRYHTLDEACKVCRDLFLEKQDYTHMAVVTDDVIFTQEHFDMLRQDVIDYQYDVISGWTNGNQTFGKEDSDISLSLPPIEPHTAKYQDYHTMTIAELEEQIKTHVIIPVKHSGMMLSFISRKIVKQIPFRTDCGCCRDACFANDLYKNNIIQYCDLRVRMQHLKKDDTEWFPLQVGKKEKEVIFESAK